MAHESPDNGVANALGRIYIRDLTTRCIIGINPDERENTQDVVINIVLMADLRPAAQSDRIEDAVDYKGVKKKVLALVEGSSFFMIERMADRIAARCLEDVRIQQATVTVDKPGALRYARSVAVEVTRTREA